MLTCNFRKIFGNGTLYFPPFLAQYYRADIHEAVYRCRATNEAGTILSRNMQVQAGKLIVCIMYDAIKWGEFKTLFVVQMWKSFQNDSSCKN